MIRGGNMNGPFGRDDPVSFFRFLRPLGDDFAV